MQGGLGKYGTDVPCTQGLLVDAGGSPLRGSLYASRQAAGNFLCRIKFHQVFDTATAAISTTARLCREAGTGLVTDWLRLRNTMRQSVGALPFRIVGRILKRRERMHVPPQQSCLYFFEELSRVAMRKEKIPATA